MHCNLRIRKSGPLWALVLRGGLAECTPTDQQMHLGGLATLACVFVDHGTLCDWIELAAARSFPAPSWRRFVTPTAPLLQGSDKADITKASTVPGKEVHEWHITRLLTAGRVGTTANMPAPMI